MGQHSGDLFFYFDCMSFIHLMDIFYVPNFQQNLISVSQLFRDGYTFKFHVDVTVTYNGNFCDGTCHNNLYYVHLNSCQANNIEFEQSNKRKKTKCNDFYLWHLKLGHVNPSRIQSLIHDVPLGSLKIEEWAQCE